MRQRRRGRPRISFPLSEEPRANRIKVINKDSKDNKAIVLTKTELEVIRLVDLLGYRKCEAAEILGCSRVTLHKILKNAREKIATAILNGYDIVIE